ncbi:MAG: hypothetical protein GC160_07175 [Acidobacteria bacterium]|nr:hypothetical protein [Acidobacteriota bacterium]
MPATRSLAKRLRLAALAAAPPPQAPARRPDLAIRGLDAWAVAEPEGGRAYVVVKVSTDGGPDGWGETRAAPDAETAVAAFRQAEATLRGRDALAAEATRRLLAGEPAGVRAAVDMALLDIQGKVAKAPGYDLLSGRTRDKARALAILERDEDLDLARRMGFRAFSAPVEIPAGPTRGRAFYEQTFERLQGLRRAGEDLVLDCRGETTAAEGAALAARFEQFHLLWIDEPAGEINEEALRKISDQSTTPVGWGRSIVDNAEFQDLLRLQAIDVFRLDVAVHGVRYARRAAALAEAHYTAIAPFSRGGPIATAAALQVAASTPNFFALDVPFARSERDRKMRTEIAGDGLERPREGFLALPEGPGLGVEVDEGALRRYAL